jgi:ATP-dependent DNA helicase HFM1/MER3
MRSKAAARCLLTRLVLPACVCRHRFYALKGSYSSAGRSLLLARSLRNRLWDDSGATVRQLPSVGRLLGARLAAAGLGSLHSVAACDAHRLEVAAQK